MTESVKNTISKYNMLQKNDKILVGLSGGCDSVCLCLVLLELGYDISVAHLNHGLRSTADRDENFVMEFAAKYNLAYHIKKVDIKELALKKKISEETAGRIERYSFFESICNRYGYNKIAVAHNLNDNCETFFMNLMRGSGLNGLKGIPKVRNNIVRPLIEMDRQEIEQYVNDKNETYVTDETNLKDDYTRNKIRHLILPEFLKINESYMKNISRTMDIIEADNKYLDFAAKKAVRVEQNRAYIDKEEFLLLDNSLKCKALIYAYSSVAGTNKDFEKKHIEYIIKTVSEKEHGIIIDLCLNMMCSIQNGNIVFEKRNKICDYEYNLTIDGFTDITEAKILFETRIIGKDKINYGISCCEYFDYDKIKSPIKVRNRKNGDRLIPLGMSASKKVKDILTDNKVEMSKRSILPIVTTERILWVFNVRRSAEYAIDENTQNVIMIRGKEYE